MLDVSKILSKVESVALLQVPVTFACISRTDVYSALKLTFKFCTAKNLLQWILSEPQFAYWPLLFALENNRFYF